ncbi:MAG: phage/plasmid primase, P4 family [Acidimicrobiales bacterium]
MRFVDLSDADLEALAQGLPDDDLVGVHLGEDHVDGGGQHHVGGLLSEADDVAVATDIALAHIRSTDLPERFAADPAERLEPDPTRYLGREGLLVSDIVDAVTSAGPIRTGLGRTLWYYRRGVWLPDGDAEVYRRTRVLLGNRWRRLHADTVVAWLAADEPFIGDTEPTEYLNTRSGLVDWQRGTLAPHRVDLPTTYQIPHRWDPAATCPTVEAWLADVFPADAVAFAWELLGYLLLPANPFHRAVLLHGSGRNGKGTFLRLATALVGRDHISNKTLQELGEDRFAAAGLYRKVANVAGDLDARTLKRTDVFKMATGGDRLSAQFKYGQPFEFDPIATFLFAANELPGTVDVTEGFFARWLVVPFTGYFPEGVADRTLEPRLHAEMEGVLVRAVSALRDVMARDAFEVPTSVLASTADYRSKADPVRQFAAEVLEFDPDGREPRTEVYRRYRDWCDDCGHVALARRRFYDRLRNIMAVEDRRIHGVDYWAGVRIKTTEVVL